MSPSIFKKKTTPTLTPLDKEILPRCVDDLNLWMLGYFDGQAFPYQQYFYHAPQRDKMLVAGIRTGKSRLAAMGALHFCQYRPGARYLNTSISSEQAKIVFRSCLELCQMPRFEHWVESVQNSPYPTITLTNGAELWFRSIGYDAELIRGFEFDFINVDEASYVTRKSAIDTLRGRLIGVNPITKAPRERWFWQITSPKGRGWVHDRWKLGDPYYKQAKIDQYLSLRARTIDNPLLSEEAILELCNNYTEAMIRQEIFGEFMLDDAGLFPFDLVMATCDNGSQEVQWLYNQIDLWNIRHSTKSSFRADAGLTEDITHYEVEPEAGHRYVSSWDLGKKATSKGRNAMVGMVLDISFEPWKLVGYRYVEGMRYTQAMTEIENWHNKYGTRSSTCSTIIDSTGKGDVVEELLELNGNVGDLEGITYSTASKPNLLHACKISLERDMIRMPFIQKVVDQLSNYELDDKEIPQDTVMSLAQACYRARELITPTDSVFKRQVARRDEYTNVYRQTPTSPLYRAERMARYGRGRATVRIGRR